jgi:hypothetical protein
MVAVWDALWPAPRFEWMSMQRSINGQGGINGINDIDESAGPSKDRRESQIADAGARRSDGRDVGVVAAG